MEYTQDIVNASDYLVLLVLFTPLVGALILFIINKVHLSGLISSIVGVVVFVASILLAWTQINLPIYFSMDWFTVGSFDFKAGFLLDNLTLNMLMVVSLITLLVNVFSIEYMKDDPGKNRYFMFLGLFAFSMYGIVLSSNLFLTFFFWELVGFSSYLLIGFWFQQDEPAKASFKAFIVNRVGDSGFLIALFVMFTLFKSFELPYLWEIFGGGMDASFLSLSGLPVGMLEVLLVLMGIGLFLGAVGKSAQFPLQVWLPDAMAGPTPVSALIHAATMVAAGVFMLIRVFPLMVEPVLTTLALIGSVTAFMGAFAAFAQDDIKKVLAYSTISQLGYMVMAVGVGAPDFAFFHLITHAFFKACLFLCAGSVIHFMHRQGLHDNASQEMKSMGGLRKYLPVTFIAYTISMLALAGIPFFSGFFSKEGILLAAFAWIGDKNVQVFQMIPFLLSIVSVLMTAAYMGRQYILIFFGGTKLAGDSKEINAGKEPIYFTVPLLCLAILSLWLVYAWNPLQSSGFAIIQTISESLGHQGGLGELSGLSHYIVTGVSVSLAVIGFGIAYLLFYKKIWGKQLIRVHAIFGPWSTNNWFMDTFYQIAIVKPIGFVNRLLNTIDKDLVDGLVNFAGVITVLCSQVLGWWDKYIVDGAVSLTTSLIRKVGNLTRSIQGGKIQTYFAWAIIGILLTFLLVI